MNHWNGVSRSSFDACKTNMYGNPIYEQCSIGLNDLERQPFYEHYSIGLNDLERQPSCNTSFMGATVYDRTLQISFPPCTMEEKEVQDDNQMSFIIMLTNKNGIAVASDSKSTLVDASNQKYEEKERMTQKIFSTKDLLVAASGANRVQVNQTSVELEKIFPTLLQGLSNRDDFVKMLEEKFGTMTCSPNDTYYFLVGERYLDAYRISYISYQSNGRCTIETDPVYSNASIRAMGDMTFAPRTLNIRKDWTLEQMQQAAELMVEYVIRVGETFTQNGYHSVGGPVQSKTFQ